MKLKVGTRETLVAAGRYRARVVDIKNGTYMRRKTLEFTFEILEGAVSGCRIRGFVNAHYEVFSSHTKLYAWYEAATGERLEAGEEMDLECFKEKILLVHIETKASQRTKNHFSNVTKVISCEGDL